MGQTQIRTPAVFMRGGSSKGVIFHDRDLPATREARDRLFLSVLGSPDPFGRQLDGMGGGVSSLSKAAIIGPSSHPDADVDYTFAQVAVDRPVVDYGANCGNLSGAVGPFAVDEGLVTAADGEALVRIHNTNTRKIIHARFAVRDGRAVADGDFVIPGVAGGGARIRLDFVDPAGSVASGLLPTGRAVDMLTVDGLGEIAASLVDASNPLVFVAAEDLGLTGAESPDAIDGDRALTARLEAIRRAGAVAMGLADRPENAGLANPKIAVVAAPRPFRTLDGRDMPADAADISVRMMSMGKAHRAVTLTGAMCVAAASRIPGAIPHTLAARAAVDADGVAETRVGNPSGSLPAASLVLPDGDGGWRVAFTAAYRTARRLMDGWVYARPDAAC